MKFVVPTLAVLAAWAVGCGGRSSSPTAIETPAVIRAVLAAGVPEQPAGSIADLRRTSRPGQTVVVEGRIMGRPEPFLERRAAFVLGDGSLTPCNERPGDKCPTPWDLCCEPPDAVRNGTAVLRIVDEAGRVVPMGLKGIGGLRELARVRVRAVVAPESTPEAWILDARAIAVLP